MRLILLYIIIILLNIYYINCQVPLATGAEADPNDVKYYEKMLDDAANKGASAEQLEAITEKMMAEKTGEKVSDTTNKAVPSVPSVTNTNSTVEQSQATGIKTPSVNPQPTTSTSKTAATPSTSKTAATPSTSKTAATPSTSKTAAAPSTSKTAATPSNVKPEAVKPAPTPSATVASILTTAGQGKTAAMQQEAQLRNQIRELKKKIRNERASNKLAPPKPTQTPIPVVKKL